MQQEIERGGSADAKVGPQRDDIVIDALDGWDGIEPVAVYIHGVYPRVGLPEMRSREEAVAYAIAYAARYHVRAWLPRVSGHFDLLANFART